MKSAEDRIAAALGFLQEGVPDGDHHKAWVIDQITRILTGCEEVKEKVKRKNGTEYTYTALGKSAEYTEFLAEYAEGEDGPHTYSWDCGIAP